MDEPNLHDYLAVLRRRRRVVALSVLAALAAALVISLVQTPQYRAETELLLRRTASEEILVDEVGQVRSSTDSERELNNEIRLIESREVRDAVDEAYDGPLDVDDVTAGAPASDSNDVLDISLVSSEPAEAAELVNLYAETYLTERQDRQVADLLAASEEIQTRLDGLREQIAEVSRPLDDINAQVAAAPANSPQRTQLEDQRQTVLAQVLPQLAPLQSRESSFRGQLEQLEVTQDLTRAGGIEVLAPAEEPDSPVSPNTVGNLVVGALIGLLGGIGLAFAVEYLDDSVGSKEQAERLTGLPTLGVIPKGLDGASSTELVSLEDSSSPAAEAYRSLRTSVKFLGLDASITTVLVTSAAASEGKTVTAANLATVLAQRGDRVLLVSADLRRPRIYELFGAPQSPGLTTVLLGDATAESTIYGIEEVAGLYVMPPGPTPPNPAEMLDSSRARELFASLADRYDTVIVDAPPVLPVTDAQVLAGIADAVLLVVAFRETSKRGLGRAIELLAQVDAPLVGTVLNLVPAKEGYAGEPYRYDTYRNRSERRRQREEPRDEGAAVHPAHLSGNGVQNPSAGRNHDAGPRPADEEARRDAAVDER
jgi:capsular exopolysaccharide synthesis family protein